MPDQPVTAGEQLAWQRQAVLVLAGLLEVAARDRLPVLAWSVAARGAALTGRPAGPPGSAARRGDVAAWARALGIVLGEDQGIGSVVVSGTARRLDTPWGRCSLTLTARIWDDDDEKGKDDE